MSVTSLGHSLPILSLNQARDDPMKHWAIDGKLITYISGPSLCCGFMSELDIKIIIKILKWFI